MNKFKILSIDRFVKFSIILGVLLLSFSAAYYLLYLLPNLERQKLDLQKNQIQNEKQGKDQELLQNQLKQNQEQQQTEDSQAKFNQCIQDANVTYLKMGAVLKRKGDECRQMNNMVAGSACMQAVIDSYDKNDIDYKNSKDDCYMQYPQR